MQQDVKIYPITHLYDVCHLHTPTELRGKRKIPNFITSLQRIPFYD